MRTVVSQGCEPVGRDSVITSAEGNVVFELAGEPALERLKGDLGTLTPGQERSAARAGVLAGLVIDENRSEYRRGDYLMRGLMGVDEETGAIAVGEEVRVGQTLRFHVRDAESADDDLRETLAAALTASRAAGALIFTCNGRGTNMFAEPDHDARAVGELLGADALAGFFCARRDRPRRREAVPARLHRHARRLPGGLGRRRHAQAECDEHRSGERLQAAADSRPAQERCGPCDGEGVGAQPDERHRAKDDA